jgi:hypothetical protein
MMRALSLWALLRVMGCSNRGLLAPEFEYQYLAVLTSGRFSENRKVLTFIHPTEL